jgi:hypothetical protein
LSTVSFDACQPVTGCPVLTSENSSSKPATEEQNKKNFNLSTMG